MGREIRRVPADWEHPRTEAGYYQPMFDRTFEEGIARAEQYGEDPPTNPAYYRPAWDSEPTHYQIYETVTEGTPWSPVFGSLDELVEWLIKEGYSEKAARRFAEVGWVPSMVMAGSKGLFVGIHSCDIPGED
jgi:hypothetical protein